MFKTDDSEELKQHIAKGKHLVLFYASWCPDCSRFLPAFDSLSSRTSFPLAKAQTDEDENPIWDDFKIARVPAVVLFENGKEKSRVEENGGAVDSSKLKKMLS